MKIPKRTRIKVTVVGHDSWSGPEILYVKEFSYRKNAEKFCEKYNSRNNKAQVPEYYTKAHLPDSWFLTIRR